jgi:gamma-glutamyltranspeptidase/glutathione hydrolase
VAGCGVARPAPFSSRFARRAMVCAVDHHAAQAGVWMLRQGGNALDAALAASAVLAVTTQHMCGLGGDLFALVHAPSESPVPLALNASGRSGSGADPERLRRRGLREMPMWGDVSAVPVPGYVDGWIALHQRVGSLPRHHLLEPAIRYAEDGFPATRLLAATAPSVAGLPGAGDFAGVERPGTVVRRPGVARTLRAIADHGRDGFYGSEFGEGLVALGAGEYTNDDLAESNADWVEPLQIDAWGRRLWTVPPNSQGYLTLSSAWIADGLALPDTADPLWAHLLIEASRQAGHDRVEVLHEGADGAALLSLDRLRPRRASIDPHRAAELGSDESYRPGGTTYLCAVDEHGMGVSLIQSNAAGFGSRLVEARTGIFLQNRGIGFSLVPGHPAEYGPRRRPPHTLAPALVTDAANGRLAMVIGTMGGDAQPQIVLQLLARILHNGEAVGDAIAAPRWTLEGPAGASAFQTWAEAGRVEVALEPDAPAQWRSGLEHRGHRVTITQAHGHAHAIVCRGDHLEGASDPRALAGEAAGY